MKTAPTAPPKFVPKVITPIGDRVTIREAKPEDRTKSGIILPPNTQRSRARTGVVVACGDGVTSKAFAPGDTVVLAEYAGMEIEVEGEKLLLISTAELVAKLT